MKIKLPFEKDIQNLKTGSMSLRIRLFAFLSALVFVMVLAVFIILFLTGRISHDYSAPKRFAQKEFTNLYNDFQDNLGETAVQLISLSQGLSRSIEFQLSEKQISSEKIREHPQVLNEIIANEVNRLQLGLERTKCSGVFLIFDATVNPSLPNAEFSKAGLYIRRFEPEVSGTPEIRYFFYRGSTSIAYQNDFYMRAAWDMEFNIKDCNYYRETIKAGGNNLPLSKLFYWSLESVIPQLDEPTLLCSIPLIDSHGNVFGIAGFEISAWNFDVNYAPDNSEYKETICFFGELKEDSFYIPNALTAGSPPATGKIRGKESLSVTAGKGMNTYICKNGIVYMGLHENVKLYSRDSFFKDQNLCFSILLPKDEVDSITAGVHLRIALISIALLVIGIVISYFISKRYLKPITSVINGIKTGQIDKTDKTRVTEIDDVLDYINKLIEKQKPKQIKTAPKKNKPEKDNTAEDNSMSVSFEELSYQELRIADLTLRGYSYTEIAGVLKIKPNTVKWYQKELYSKLGINSKRELFELAAKRKKTE